MSHADLLHLLDHWKPTRIVVAGDFMLDRYAFGNADRLSPDAPVPILAVERTESRPGGSGNVALDLAALRCEVSCLGVVGDDEAGQTLRGVLRQHHIDTTGLITDPSRPTTVKHNLIGLAQHRHPQKMFRLDTESKAPIDENIARQLLDRAHTLLDDADVLCIEDYGKGVLTDPFAHSLIELARMRSVPVLVDPASIEDYGKYRGADAVTPNRTEAIKATGLTNPAAMAEAIHARYGIRHVVLTLDKHGALLRLDDGSTHTIPTRARQVYDVTGAGDMVLAMLAGALANGATWVQAVQLANVAAGLEVEKPGVVPIPLDEILIEVLREHHATLGKVRTLDELLPELAAHRKQGASIAFTNGCFDILHAGHVSYLRRARQQADLLVVGLNSDASITRLKGQGRPVNPLADRLLVLSELQSIDYLVVFEDDTPVPLIEAIQPDKLIKGGDYTKERVVGHEIVEHYGGQIVLIDLVEGRSTTNLIQKLAAPGKPKP
jgi:D-beta-D-heptose 7-phosphate kinase/D-beta-D-heptose 1-phosphate adenosyltransferase